MICQKQHPFRFYYFVLRAKCDMRQNIHCHTMVIVIRTFPNWLRTDQWVCYLTEHFDLRLSVIKITLQFSKNIRVFQNFRNIYKSKFYLKELSIKGFENFLKQKFINEMYIAKINKTYDKFLGKWSSLYNYMITV